MYIGFLCCSNLVVLHERLRNGWSYIKSISIQTFSERICINRNESFVFGKIKSGISYVGFAHWMLTPRSQIREEIFSNNQTKWKLKSIVTKLRIDWVGSFFFFLGIVLFSSFLEYMSWDSRWTVVETKRVDVGNEEQSLFRAPSKVSSGKDQFDWIQLNSLNFPSFPSYRENLTKISIRSLIGRSFNP